MAVLSFGACAASAMNYAILDQGTSSGKRFPSLHFEVITEAEPFEMLFAQIHANRVPPPLPPEVDFQKWLVAFVSLGEKPSAGYRVAVEEVTRDKETARIKIRVQEPPPNEFQAAVITRPFVLIKIKKEPRLKQVALIDAENNLIRSLPIP